MAAPSVSRNMDPAVVKGFSQQWTFFDQTQVPEEVQRAEFDAYYQPFRWDLVNKNSEGFDIGCGTGRWDKYLAPRVGKLHCIEPSDALEVAKKMLKDQPNVEFHRGGLADHVLPPNSMDFGVCVGVLHYVPSAAEGIKQCAEMLKPGAPLLIYVYYRFDNRPKWFRAVWEVADVMRKGIAKLPFGSRKAVTNVIAAVVYWPLTRATAVAEKMGMNVDNVPLTIYRHQSFYAMKTDSLDRFGMPREHRYTKAELIQYMQDAGLEDIRVSPNLPFWCLCGVKKA